MTEPVAVGPHYRKIPRDMALKLCVSSNTIATHKYRILKKLGIQHMISLARLAEQYGITEPTLQA